MSIRLFDSKEGALRAFVPLEPNRVSVYVCGPTVQSSPHVGHLRSALVYDLLRRWLTHEGYDVTLVRNVTDIDDKVLDNAAAAGIEKWWALAYRMELEFSQAYAALGILPPTYEPRATASIPEMIALIERLIDRGHAYVAADDSGDVYFDTRRWPSYGSLTHQNPDDMDAAADADLRGKNDARDFALWKGHKVGEPDSANWTTPWGGGRPGWHIECSAMATKYLGSSFDIHGGGLDLRFPHHENELAQSEAAGDGFAQYWLHNGLVSIGGQKMSKSLGNSVFAADLLAASDAIVLRYLLGSAHYRSTLELHETAIAEAQAAFDRITGFLARVNRSAAADVVAGQVPEAFREAMNDDLNIPQGIAVIFDEVRSGNTMLDDGMIAKAVSIAERIVAMLDVLGLNPGAPEWNNTGTQPSAVALELLLEQLLLNRQEARDTRDFAAADKIRDNLAAAGITIEDTPTGAHWSLHGR
ncbi:cysteine--tRNA ligase [Alpinimonas psychrophila]|uniref:Cysteine--tRNA ligase n=1 Tax=Alpinimonas psychrophila TaxID=748908 RepID=A0A7W3JRM9_9MICO|nr:cysteinyl-tRNA synthetase [Alpinimonas psychrophila]